MLTLLPPPSVVPCCGHCIAARHGPLAISLPLLLSLIASVSRVVGEFPSSARPRPPAPGTPSPSGFTPEVSSPPGNASTREVSMPLGNSTPPPTSWRPPPGFFRHSEGLTPPPLLSPLQRTRQPGFPADRQPYDSPFFFTPWQPPAPATSASSEVTSQVSPPPAAAPLGNSPAPLPSDSHTIAVIVWPTYPDPPAVAASSSVADSSV